jgi:hypothetical protein
VSTALSDYLAEILLGHPQLKDVRMLSNDLLDYDLLRLIHQGSHDIFDKLLHHFGSPHPPRHTGSTSAEATTHLQHYATSYTEPTGKCELDSKKPPTGFSVQPLAIDAAERTPLGTERAFRLLRLGATGEVPTGM